MTVDRPGDPPITLYVAVFPPNFGAPGWEQVHSVPYASLQEAIDHMTEYTADWQPWSIGEVTIVHSYVPPEDEDEYPPGCNEDRTATACWWCGAWAKGADDVIDKDLIDDDGLCIDCRDHPKDRRGLFGEVNR